MKKAMLALALGALSALAVGCTGGTTTTITTTVATSSSTATVAPPTTDPTTTVVSPQNLLGPPVGPVINHAVDSACGTELWAKKTLQDQDSRTIDVTPVQGAQVTDLNQISDSGAGGEGRVGIERHVYMLKATLTEAKLERDSDIHLVLSDQNHGTIIAEFPAPECVQDAAPAARQEIDQARQDFLAACGQNLSAGSFTTLSGTATITGVGFYDTDHGQSGRDSLGDGFDAEIHPVLGFKGSCPGQGQGHAAGTD